jgi:hypothetical protein
MASEITQARIATAVAMRDAPAGRTTLWSRPRSGPRSSTRSRADSARPW